MALTEEKRFFYANPLVKEELGLFLQEYGKQREQLFIVYLLQKAKKDFLFFCRLFYPFCSNGENLQVHDGIKVETTILQLHFDRKITSPIIINTCPGHGKSTIIDVLYSAFLLLNESDQIIKTYTSSAKTLRDNFFYFSKVVSCGVYQFVANHKNIVINNNGFFIDGVLVKAMRTIKTGIGGENATQIIVDDANDMTRITGADFENTNNAIARSILTRQRPKHNARPPIFTQQRVSIIDNTNFLIESFEKAHMQYLHVAIKQFEPRDVVYKIPCADGTQFEITRKAGNLWDNPEIMKIVNLNKVNQYVYLAQYQQTPEQASGLSIFKRAEFFKRETLQDLHGLFITTDLSYREDGDKLCFCLWGWKKGEKTPNGGGAGRTELVLIKVLYESFTEDVDRVRLLELFYQQSLVFKEQNNKKLYFHGILVETSGNTPLTSDFKKADLPVIFISRARGVFSGGKSQRALLAMGYKSNVNLCCFTDLVGSEAFETASRELSTVSLGNIGKNTHDDFVDNVIDAIIFSYNID